MSKLEETNTMIDMIAETINVSSPKDLNAYNKLYFAIQYTLLGDIAKSLAIIADGVSEESGNKTI